MSTNDCVHPPAFIRIEPGQGRVCDFCGDNIEASDYEWDSDQARNFKPHVHKKPDYTLKKFQKELTTINHKIANNKQMISALITSPPNWDEDLNVPFWAEDVSVEDEEPTTIIEEATPSKALKKQTQAIIKPINVLCDHKDPFYNMDLNEVICLDCGTKLDLP